MCRPNIFSMYVGPKNVEVVDYYLLRWTQVKFKLTKPSTNDDNHTYPIGLVVIEGIDYPLMRSMQVIREWVINCKYLFIFYIIKSTQ